MRQRFLYNQERNFSLIRQKTFFVGSNRNFGPGYIKKVDKHNESSVRKKQVIKLVIDKKHLTSSYDMNSKPML